MIFCTKCGSKLNTEKKFCTNCGQVIPKLSQENTYTVKDQQSISEEVVQTVLNENTIEKDLEAKSLEVNITKAMNTKAEEVKKSDNNKKSKKIIITCVSIIIILGITVSSSFIIKSKYNEKNNEVTDNSSDDKKNDTKEDVSEDKKTEDKLQNDNKTEDENIERKWTLDQNRLDKSPKLKNDYVINTSNTVKITFSELNDYTIDELFVARNEMLARYGYSFTGKDNLKKYFQSKSWYKEDPSFSGTMPSEVETLNFNMLETVEHLKMAYEKSGDIKTDYVLSLSNTQLQSESRIMQLTDWELIIARNEIYARYGLNFSTKEIKNHFMSKSWFKVNDAVGNDLALNEIENKNLQLILTEEKKRMKITFDHDL